MNACFASAVGSAKNRERTTSVGPAVRQWLKSGPRCRKRHRAGEFRVARRRADIVEQQSHRTSAIGRAMTLARAAGPRRTLPATTQVEVRSAALRPATRAANASAPRAIRWTGTRMRSSSGSRLVRDASPGVGHGRASRRGVVGGSGASASRGRRGHQWAGAVRQIPSSLFLSSASASALTLVQKADVVSGDTATSREILRAAERRELAIRDSRASRNVGELARRRSQSILASRLLPVRDRANVIFFEADGHGTVRRHEA